MKRADPGTFGYRLLTPLMKPIFRLWYNPKVIDRQNIPAKGAVVIAGNHKHIYDQCLTIISTGRPINYLAKKEYFEGGLRGFFKFVGCIPVNRDGKDAEASRTALNVLKRGGAIGIFPEGTRNRTDAALLPFKFGAVSLASKTGAPVVPVGVTGDYTFRSRNLTVRFGEPFTIGDMPLEEANKKLEAEVERLMRANLRGEIRACRKTG